MCCTASLLPQPQPVGSLATLSSGSWYVLLQPRISRKQPRTASEKLHSQHLQLDS